MPVVSQNRVQGHTTGMMHTIAFLVVLITLIHSASGFGPALSSIQPRARNIEMSLTKESVALYTTKYASAMSNPESRYAVDEKTLASNFLKLAETVRGDDNANEICTIWPDILRVDPVKISTNMNTYVDCFGLEDAIGMVKRNPNLFAVATTGYGSAEASCAKGGGKDMMTMSYVIAFTRPIGQPLLALLAVCLLKAVVFGPGMPSF